MRTENPDRNWNSLHFVQKSSENTVSDSPSESDGWMEPGFGVKYDILFFSVKHYPECFLLSDKYFPRFLCLNTTNSLLISEMNSEFMLEIVSRLSSDVCVCKSDA